MPYTLVRHTGYSVGGKPEFQHAVEEISVQTQRQERAIRRAGGLIYASYVGASDAAFRYNYPRDHKGLAPKAAGKFVKRAAFDEEIFVPETHL